MRILKTVVVVLSLLMTRTVEAALSFHYPGSTVYPTGTPGSGDSDVNTLITFRVFVVEITPWDEEERQSSPYGGWNISLSWSYHTPGSTATAKITDGPAETHKTVTVQNP